MVIVVFVATALSGNVIGSALNAHSGPDDLHEVTVRVLALAPFPEAPSSCDSNYSGACVPVARDVDCAGGSGNGPAYVSGPVTVVGNDIYGLDRDGDGVACDS